ncbi:MAG: hypothetical protein ISR95_00375 [Candidatus Marinimicrobia bacterium]|nr:hypothetical protein [Candidatus Neomarinimicrobiota bacterium]
MAEQEEALGDMLEEMFYLEQIDSAEQYIDYMITLRDAGFTKEDSLSIFTNLISKDQEMD